MPKRNGDYWKQRFDQIGKVENSKSAKYLQELEDKTRRAEQQIDAQINSWYQRFANNNEITVTDAKRLLNGNELKELRWSVQDYIKHGQENAIDQRWMKELENASAKFHINRLEALKLQTRQQIEVMTGGMVDDVDKLIRNVYKDSYYRSAFEIQRGIGIGFDVGKLDEKKLTKLVNKPWAVDGKNFSERIWGNKAKLLNTLDQELSRMALTGESPKRAIDNIKKAMHSSTANAQRLVYTEQAYFTSLAQHDLYDELGVEEFEFVSTLDGTTCELCGEMDGKHFPIKDMVIGVNAPPMHPGCGCSTCPYFDDEFTDGLRASRNEAGETVYEVPEKMTYKEWKNSFVNGGSKDGLDPDKMDLQEYRPINRSGTATQFKRGDKTLSVRTIENTTYEGGIQISDSVELKPRQMHNIETSLNDAVKCVGVGDNLPTCVIISSGEMQTGALCAYNATTNVMYIDSVIGDTNKLLELQKGMACADNPLSTYVHELLHWKDAEDYRKIASITNQKEYLSELREKCKRKLDKLQAQGYNIYEISEYATNAYDREMFDETWTEYMVQKVLGEGR